MRAQSRVHRWLARHIAPVAGTAYCTAYFDSGAEGGGGCICGGIGDVVIDFQVAIPENGVIAQDAADAALTVTGAPIVGTVKTIQ